jgi:hypothetical protein
MSSNVNFSNHLQRALSADGPGGVQITQQEFEALRRDLVPGAGIGTELGRSIGRALEGEHDPATRQRLQTLQEIANRSGGLTSRIAQTAANNPVMSATIAGAGVGAAIGAFGGPGGAILGGLVGGGSALISGLILKAFR